MGKETLNPDNKQLKEYVMHKSGSAGGLLVGKRHSDSGGGIEAVVAPDNKKILVESGEIIITRPAVSDPEKREFEGKLMTNREILSKINSDAGGVSFSSGGDIPETIQTCGKSYLYGGKLTSDNDIVSSCGCKHKMAEGGILDDSDYNKVDLVEWEYPYEANKNIIALRIHYDDNTAFLDLLTLEDDDKFIFSSWIKTDYFKQDAFKKDGVFSRVKIREEVERLLQDGVLNSIQKENVKSSALRYMKMFDKPAAEPKKEAVTPDPTDKNILNMDSYFYINRTTFEVLSNEGKPAYTGKSLTDAILWSKEQIGYKLQLSDIPAEVKTFMPVMQQKAIVGSVEHWGTLRELYNIVTTMPKTYETGKIPEDEKIIYLHYFYGNMDWYVAEKDKEKEQLQAFGYVNLGDPQNAEWGYIDIEEIKATNKVELDFNFDPIKFGELMGKKTEEDNDNIEEEITAAGEREYEEQAEREISTNGSGKIMPAKIYVIDRRYFTNYDDANTAVKDFIKYEKVSNMPYEIVFTDGESIKGSIDVEPKEFWNDKPEPFTWHLQTFYSNIAATPEEDYSKPNWSYKKADVDFAKYILDKYYLGEPQIKAVAAEPVSPESITPQTVTADMLVNNGGGKISSKKQFEINNAVKALIKEKGSDRSKYSADELALLRLWSGSGSLAKQGAQGTGLLDQFFTPPDIVAKMWGLAIKYGFSFNGANIGEFACGVGRFFDNIPKDVACNVIAYDIDETAVTICRVLYPQYDIRLGSFESMFFTGRRHIGLAGLKQPFDLVITNPPYRSYVSEYSPLGEKEATGADTFEMYFLMRGVDVLKKGGLCIMIVPNTFMNNDTKYNDFKEVLFKKADLIDGYRLPNGVFPNTEVGTDILVLRKKGEEKKEYAAGGAIPDTAIAKKVKEGLAIINERKVKNEFDENDIDGIAGMMAMELADSVTRNKPNGAERYKKLYAELKPKIKAEIELKLMA